MLNVSLKIELYWFFFFKNCIKSCDVSDEYVIFVWVLYIDLSIFL